MNPNEYNQSEKWRKRESQPQLGKIFDILGGEEYRLDIDSIARQLQENPSRQSQFMKGIDAIKQLPEFDALRKKMAAAHPELVQNETDIGPMTVALAVGVLAFILFIVKRSHDRYDK